MKRIVYPDTNKFYRFEMTLGEYQALVDDYEGLCIACGAARGCCEPDARKYECTDGCGQFRVYGAEELMMLDRIKLEDQEDAS